MYRMKTNHPDQKNGKHRYFEKLNEKLSLVLVHSIISMTIYKRINKKKEVK